MKIPLSVCIGIVISTLFTSCSSQLKVQSIVAKAEEQTSIMLTEIDKAKQKPKSANLVVPRHIDNNGDLKLVTSREWTSGFFPGTLWYLYDYTGDTKWLNAAKAFTATIEKEQFDKGTHDTGFKIYCSYGNGYRLTNSTEYKAVIIQTAKTLSTRFNTKTGVIRSWDHNKDKWKYPVIIDNMMNLELLFAATRLSADSSFYKIAVSHANVTMKNHFRPNYSSYHVIDYEPATGKVLKKNTHQGYSDASAWARGQAWGLYGYTFCYRFTKNPAYLKQAENIAAFILNHPNLPEDKIPYWDFNAPNIPNEPRDASSAAIIASALYELSTYSNKADYKASANKIMRSLTENYRSLIGDNKGFILLHSVSSKPANQEVDSPLNYADYYYLEALLRKDDLKHNRPLAFNLIQHD